MEVQSLGNIDMHGIAGGAVACRWSGGAGQSTRVALCCRRERWHRDRGRMFRVSSGGSHQCLTEHCQGRVGRPVVECARGSFQGSELHRIFDHDHRVGMLGPGLEAVWVVEQQHRVELSLLWRVADQVLRLVVLFRAEQTDLWFGADPWVDQQPRLLCPLRLTAEFESCQTELVSDSADHRLGDPTVFDAFYRSNAESLLRYFYRRTDDPDVAADLCAETFAAALTNSGQFDVRRGSAEAWLYGIAKRQLAMYWRRRKVADRARTRLGIPREPIDEESVEALRRTEDILDGAAALDALDKLPVKLRKAVRLRVIDQLKYSEIARQLNCSPGAARTRVSRGLHLLNEILK